MGILENVRREQEQDAKARAYDELQQKAQLGTAYATGLAEMQNKYEQALAERQAAAARSVADFAQGTLYPQQTQPQGGQVSPRNYVSPQDGLAVQFADELMREAESPYEYKPQPWAQVGA